LYLSPNTIKMIKSRRMRWAVYVARMGEMRLHKILWLESLKWRDYLVELSVVGKILLEWILGEQNG